MSTLPLNPGLEAAASMHWDALEERCHAVMREVGARPIDLPPGFELHGTFRGVEVEVSPSAMSGGPWAFTRTARVRGGEGMQAFNMVLYPKHGSMLPILGAEILRFARGVHLVVIDLWSTVPEHEPRAPRERLRWWRDQLSGDLELLEAPGWGAEVFSADLIFARPAGKCPLSEEALCEPILDLLRVLGAHDEHARASDEAAERMLSERARYLDIHARDEPVGPFLERLATPEWVERFTHQLLYPQWLRGGDEAIPWSARR